MPVELELDIDHILEWMPDGGSFRYRIAPARLRFFGVTDLRIDLDWARSSAAMGPFSIDGIERRVEQRTHYKAVCWRISVKFPPGEISFEATGFEQYLSLFLSIAPGSISLSVAPFRLVTSTLLFP